MVLLKEHGIMDKKSFIIHIDSLSVLDELTDQQTAELFRAIYDYHAGKEIKLSGLMKAIFIPFQNQFERDNDKYLTIKEKNRQNALKRWQKSNATACDRIQSDAKHADSDNDSGNDNDSKKEKKSQKSKKDFSKFDKKYLDLYKKIITYFPKSVRNGLTTNEIWAWVDEIRKLRELDGHSLEHIHRVVKSARENEFWSKNFLSLRKLREKDRQKVKYFTVFENQMKTSKTKYEIKPDEYSDDNMKWPE